MVLALPRQSFTFHAAPFNSEIHSQLCPGQKEQQDMGQFGKRNGDEQQFTADNMRRQPESITPQFITANHSGNKRRHREQKDKIIVFGCENPDFRQDQPSKGQEKSTDNDAPADDIRDGLVQ